MNSTGVVQKTPQGDVFADLTAACAAGLVAALEVFLVKLLDQQHVPASMYVKYILLAVASYSAVALFLHRIWTGTLRHVVPNWILMAVGGSVLFVLIRLTPGVIEGWYDPHTERLQPSLFNYLSTELDAAKSVVIILSFITIPIAGFAYYVVTVGRRRWLNHG